MNETNSKKWNYAIWKKYLNLKVDVYNNDVSESLIVPKSNVYSPIIQKGVVLKDDSLNKDMFLFIEFIINKIENETILKKKGWVEQLNSYQWPPERGNLKEGINLRKHFSYILNCAAKSTGFGSEIFKHGVCNAVAGWGGLRQVSKEDSLRIFESINYLQSIVGENSISCDKIFGRRIALASKLYYFSYPLHWTIYDSRVALTLSQLAYHFKEGEKDLFYKLKDKITFPVPPTQSTMRKNPLNVQWSETKASQWFVKASLLLKAIADQLKKESYPPPEVMFPSHSWELYHVEMVFFRIGERNWD